MSGTKYSPSEKAKDLLKSLMSSIEDLSPRDRGYVTSRLVALYGPKQPSATSAPVRNDTRKTPVKDPNSITSLLESSSEAKAFRAFVKEHKDESLRTPEETKQFQMLQQAFFRKRAEVKAEKDSKKLPSLIQGIPTSAGEASSSVSIAAPITSGVRTTAEEHVQKRPRSEKAKTTAYKATGEMEF